MCIRDRLYISWTWFNSRKLLFPKISFINFSAGALSLCGIEFSAKNTFRIVYSCFSKFYKVKFCCTVYSSHVRRKFWMCAFWDGKFRKKLFREISYRMMYDFSFYSRAHRLSRNDFVGILFPYLWKIILPLRDGRHHFAVISTYLRRCDIFLETFITEIRWWEGDECYEFYVVRNRHIIARDC